MREKKAPFSKRRRDRKKNKRKRVAKNRIKYLPKIVKSFLSLGASNGQA